MNNKKLILALVALILVVGVLAGVWFATRPQSTEGVKNITVCIVHSDKTEKTLTYSTDKEFLGELLLAEGLIEGENGYYTVVDGEEALWNDTTQAYWSLLINGEYAMQGMDTTPLADGDVYKLEYTLG